MPELTAAVQRNNELVEALHQDLVLRPTKEDIDAQIAASERKWRNRFGALAVVVLLVVGVFGYSVKARHDGDVTTCVRSNELRGGLLNVANTLESFTVGRPGGQTDDDKVFIAELRSDFALRDCGNVGWL